MSFARFDAGTLDWDAPLQAGQNTSIEIPDRDPRIDEVQLAIEKMEQAARPAVLSEKQWFGLLRDCRHIADNWLDIALMCGWGLEHLFGSPPAPRGRVGITGIALLLDGRLIDAVDQDRIIILNRLGAPNVFRRHADGVSEPFDWTGSELIWNLINREEWK